MQTKLAEIIYQIISQYPILDDLSKARLTKLVYLADWHFAINHQAQISEINWYFDNYGPFVWDVFNEVKDSKIFIIKETINNFGNSKTLISINSKLDVHLRKDEIHSIQFIIDKTKDLTWDKFIGLIYSTYPIVISSRYSTLNLVELAKKYIE